MITRRAALGLMTGALAVAALSALPGAASAAERVPFDRAAFEAALKTGGPVLVDVSATWCITCKQQHVVLDRLFAEPKYAGFTVFTVDYDTEKDVMRSFGVQQRATLIAFKGGKEVDRASWQTSEAAIAALLAKAVEPATAKRAPCWPPSVSLSWPAFCRCCRPACCRSCHWSSPERRLSTATGHWHSPAGWRCPSPSSACS